MYPLFAGAWKYGRKRLLFEPACLAFGR